MIFLGFQCFRYFDVAVHSVTSSLILKLRNQAIRVHTKRQVIIKMNKFNMLITAVCVLFLIYYSLSHLCLRYEIKIGVVVSALPDIIN